MSAFFHVHDFKRVPKLNMCSTYHLLLDHRLSGFILNMQEHCKQNQKKETITYLLAISCHIWDNNLGWNTDTDFPHRSCKISPLLSNMAGKSAAIREKPGCQVPVPRFFLISTEGNNFYGGGQFLRRRLISTQEVYFYGARQFLCNRLTFV